jgi:hypothetical protein
MEIAQWTRVLGRYAERLHAQAGHGHHVVSPLGAWMVVALCGPIASRQWNKVAIANDLGADPDAAFGFVSALIADPHPLVTTAIGLWFRRVAETPRFETWRESLPSSIDTGDIPTQAELDAWSAEHTRGLIERFPLEIGPTTLCLLASALAAKVSWEVPFEVVDASELGPSRWSGRVRAVLRAPRGDPRHRQFLAKTERAGTVCVHLAEARGGLLVGSVIAADEDVPPDDVLAAAEELVTAEARERGSVSRLSLFDLPLGKGTLWTLREEPAQNVKTRDGRVEQVVSVLPAWRATTAVELLGDEALGFDGAAAAIAWALELDHFVYEARQVCSARYSAVGFEAAAVTGLMVAVSAGRPGIRRVAEVRFAHPYAVVSAAFDPDAQHGSAGSRSVWDGLPVFSAWVEDPSDAE